MRPLSRIKRITSASNVDTCTNSHMCAVFIFNRRTRSFGPIGRPHQRDYKRVRMLRPASGIIASICTVMSGEMLFATGSRAGKPNRLCKKRENESVMLAAVPSRAVTVHRDASTRASRPVHPPCIFGNDAPIHRYSCAECVRVRHAAAASDDRELII